MDDGWWMDTTPRTIAVKTKFQVASGHWLHNMTGRNGHQKDWLDVMDCLDDRC